ncbi:MAG: hypothetical protein ACNA71_06535 [Kiritimatiellia bacterium]
MNRNGITLIETVVVLVLIGLLGFSIVLAVVPVTRGMLMTRGSVNATQKTHLAFSRLVREFTGITNVVSGTGQSMVYEFADSAGVSHQRSVSWSAGGALLLDGVPLTDDVAAFALRYYAAPDGAAQHSWGEGMRMVEMLLQPASFRSVVFTNRVYLRGLE